jgi:mRNA-degrading endonuclease RelE of RelBE toxin-antitoxin system
MYEVFFTKSVLKQVKDLPDFIQKKLAVLVDELREKGPIRAEWPNFSKLGKDESLSPGAQMGCVLAIPFRFQRITRR